MVSQQTEKMKKLKCYLASIIVLTLLLGCNREEKSSTIERGSVSSSTVDVQTKLDSARKALKEGKVGLINEGKYKCCITEVCDACALAEFECYCYELLKTKEAVCFECFDGWQQGKGVDPKIKKEDVRMVRHVNACNVHAKPRG